MDDEILQEFLAESWENLSRLDSEIVELEKKPDDAGLLASIFRTIHTIKGTCGFIGLSELGSVAHSAENVLGQMRNEELEVTGNAISLVLRAIDQIKTLLQGIEATGQEPQVDNKDIIAELQALAESGKQSTSGAMVAHPAMSVPAPVPPTVLSPVPAVAVESPPSPAPPEPIRETAPVATPPQVEPSTPMAQAQAGSQSPPSRAPKEKDIDPETGEPTKKGVADLSIRVNVDVLDSLMNLVGELVLTRNQLLQLARGDDESKYAAPIAHLNRVTTDLQEGVMKTRMQPIGNAWSKLPRLVRDLTQVTGKQIELEMSGSETELDRTVLDAIKDPLTHMVRNSADHGVESAHERRANGKPEVGKIRLNAYHEGGHVIICIEDDGAGINTAKVRQKAIKSGLIKEADASKISDNEALQFIFHPGFSTADKVSSVSGRGVGMDVVKTSIEKIGGTVDLSSAVGQGTVVKIKIPLTLAIISALVVESGGQSFAIPQLGVVELVRLAYEDRHRIEKIHNHQVFRLRDRLLPLVYLNEELGLSHPDERVEEDVNIVVVQVGDDQVGLIVSEVFDTEEIVVKPVGSLLKDVDIYQGTTILGDGRVIMILDVAGIAAQFGGLSSGTAERERSVDSDSESDGEVTSLLLFNAGDDTIMSVPLSLVARLEEVPQSAIERTGECLVVQYRGDLLPLLPISGMNAYGEMPDPQPVVVFSEGSSAMGLMVREIQDITEERLIVRMQSHRPGVLGTAIINGKATDVIDTQHYLMQANPEWFITNGKKRPRRILVADDSLFFRQLVTTALESDSYRVKAVESAMAAVELIEHGEQFDLIVSDIEMPGMTGIEFAEWLRARTDTKQLPMVALSGLKGSTYQTRAMQAGFDRFMLKFNAQQLLSSIQELFETAEMATGVSA